jgi:DNA-binding MarR family transcriptional regulator
MKLLRIATIRAYDPAVSTRIPKESLAAWRHFLKAHAAVVSSIERDLDERGLVPLVWYDVLIAIAEAPNRRLRLRDVARELVLTRSGATRLVDKLEAAGLVRRERSEDDRRGAVAVLTAEGGCALSAAWPVYAAGIRERFADMLSPSEIRIIRDAMRRIEQGAAAR